MSNFLNDEKFEMMLDMLCEGNSIREISRKTGISKTTVASYKNGTIEEGAETFECPCGRESGHRGWCSYRYKNSEKRQEFMRRWKTAQQKMVYISINPMTPILFRAFHRDMQCYHFLHIKKENRSDIPGWVAIQKEYSPCAYCVLGTEVKAL